MASFTAVFCCSLALLALATAASDQNEIFNLWKQQNNKTYSPQEETLRQRVFQNNLHKIQAHNSKNGGFKMAVNAFADLTADEFRQTHLGLRPTAEGTFRTAKSPRFSHGNVTAPSEMDWRKKGAVTAVKNQLFCGSCWAYSTTGSVEGVNYLYSGKLVTLSEQQLVDCDTSKDMGCSGGLMDNAFEYIIKNGGLDTEEDYAYWSIDESCNKMREDRKVVSIDSYEDVPANSESDLEKAVASQPVSVAICASSLQFYSSGIVDSCCTELDHGVLAVGYGKENGVPYWIVKNSWGESWGESGYFKLKKDIEKPAGMCHIAEVPSYPLKSSPNPAHVPEVCGFLGWSECTGGLSCTCTNSLLDLVCLSWACSESPTAESSSADLIMTS